MKGDSYAGNGPPPQSYGATNDSSKFGHTNDYSYAQQPQGGYGYGQGQGQGQPQYAGAPQGGYGQQGAVGNMGHPTSAGPDGRPIYVVDQAPPRRDFVSDLFLYILAIFIPPASVAFKRGCGAQTWINILLWILLWIPAVVHAFYIIAVTPDVPRR